MAGEHVFGDGRIGVWLIPSMRDGQFDAQAFTDKVRDRAPKLKRLGFTDAFFPREAALSDLKTARDAGLFTNLWTAPHGRTADTYGRDTVADVKRLLGASGAVDLNVELPRDDDLNAYMSRAVSVIRQALPQRRLRLNVAWRKGQFIPMTTVQADANLYCCEQNYVDPIGMSMSPTSALDAFLNLVDFGCPIDKAAVCYGAAGPVGGKTGDTRVNTLPNGGGWMPRRGVVFSDDLLADGGLI